MVHGYLRTTLPPTPQLLVALGSPAAIADVLYVLIRSSVPSVATPSSGGVGSVEMRSIGRVGRLTLAGRLIVALGDGLRLNHAHGVHAVVDVHRDAGDGGRRRRKKEGACTVATTAQESG